MPLPSPGSFFSTCLTSSELNPGVASSREAFPFAQRELCTSPVAPIAPILHWSNRQAVLLQISRHRSVSLSSELSEGRVSSPYFYIPTSATGLEQEERRLANGHCLEKDVCTFIENQLTPRGRNCHYHSRSPGEAKRLAQSCPLKQWFLNPHPLPPRPQLVPAPGQLLLLECFSKTFQNKHKPSSEG